MSDDTETGDTKNTDTPDAGNIVDINRWRDFNDAEPQQLDGAWPAHAVESTGELKWRMLVNIRGVLSYLFPGGVFQRGKFFVGDIRGNPGDSLNVEIEGRKAGMWHDFATGEGGNIIELWAAATGRDLRSDFPAIVDDIRAWLDGRTRTLHNDRAERPRHRSSAPLDELGPVTAKWDYLDEAGRLIACVYRYDPPGGKQFRPWDVRARKARAPEPRPLYNQPGIKAAADVILVEGEKAADALIEQGICATTAMHGAKAPVGKTDWSPLKAKRVLVWPDHDEPGRQYARATSQAVLEAGTASVSVLNPPANKPEKWDAADAVAEGMDVISFVANAGRQKIAATNPAISAHTLGSLLSDTSPMPDDIIGPRVLTPSGVLVFGGAPKVGKSDFLLSWLVHMAAGVRFLSFTPPRPLRVCYLQAEIQYHYTARTRSPDQVGARRYRWRTR